jgi:hypothetical protein
MQSTSADFYYINIYLLNNSQRPPYCLTDTPHRTNT